MRIGIDIRALDPARPTGVGRYISSLLNNFHAMDGRNVYHVYYPWKRNSRSSIRTQFGKRYVGHRGWVPEFLSAERFNTLWLDWYLPFRMVRDRIDLFHGPSFFVPTSRRAKRIVTIHDLSPVLFPELYRGISSQAIIQRTRVAIEDADAVVADSEHTRRDVINIFGVKPEKVRTIYLGIDSDYGRPVDETYIEEVRQRYSLPERFVFHVGSYHPRKNTELILEAVKLLKEKGIDMPLVLSGKKTVHFERLRRLVCDLRLDDSVTFLGYLSDDEVRAFYSAATALVYPSLYEGFCLPIIEAMASGLPCIVSDEACLPEIAGDAAVIVPADEPEQVAAEIVRVAENAEVREMLVAKGLERAKRFAWKETARRTLSLYEEIAGE